jgi:hypothetical protein
MTQAEYLKTEYSSWMWKDLLDFRNDPRYEETLNGQLASLLINGDDISGVTSLIDVLATG